MDITQIADVVGTSAFALIALFMLSKFMSGDVVSAAFLDRLSAANARQLEKIQSVYIEQSKATFERLDRLIESHNERDIEVSQAMLKIADDTGHMRTDIENIRICMERLAERGEVND